MDRIHAATPAAVPHTAREHPHTVPPPHAGETVPQLLHVAAALLETDRPGAPMRQEDRLPLLQRAADSLGCAAALSEGQRTATVHTALTTAPHPGIGVSRGEYATQLRLTARGVTH